MYYFFEREVMYDLKNEHECIIRFKSSRRSREFLNLYVYTTASFFNGFKISDIDQFILALIFRFGVIFGLKIVCFHSRGQHLCKFIGTKESVCIRKEFNSQRTGLGHQHGRRFIVLGHQYGRLDVM